MEEEKSNDVEDRVAGEDDEEAALERKIKNQETALLFSMLAILASKRENDGEAVLQKLLSKTNCNEVMQHQFLEIFQASRELETADSDNIIHMIRRSRVNSHFSDDKVSELKEKALKMIEECAQPSIGSILLNDSVSSELSSLSYEEDWDEANAEARCEALERQLSLLKERVEYRDERLRLQDQLAEVASERNEFRRQLCKLELENIEFRAKLQVLEEQAERFGLNNHPMITRTKGQSLNL